MYWLEQSAGDVPAGDQWLGAEERLCLSRLRFAKRRDDWRLGRWTAKRAVAACLELPDDPGGLAHIEIQAAPSGAPEVFLLNRKSSHTISLSHRAGTAMAVVASGEAGIGCDLELIEARSDAFVADYFTLNEQALVERTPEPERPALVTLLWSAKECALKALHLGLRLDTKQLDVSLVSPLSPKVDVVWRDTYPIPLLGSALAGRDVAPDSWHPMQVALENGPVFLGWWREAGRLLRSIACKRRKLSWSESRGNDDWHGIRSSHSYG